MEWIENVDASILLFLQEYARIPGLNEFMRGFTTLGNAGLLAIVTCLVLFILPKTRGVGLASAVSLLVEFLCVNVVLKTSVARIRPYEVIEGLDCITKLATDYSFPSGHTGSCFAVATVMFLKLPRKYGVSAMLLSALMGYSRLYVGIHYPTDVLAGLFIGVLAGMAVCQVLEQCGWYQKIGRDG